MTRFGDLGLWITNSIGDRTFEPSECFLVLFVNDNKMDY